MSTVRMHNARFRSRRLTLTALAALLALGVVALTSCSGLGQDENASAPYPGTAQTDAWYGEDGAEESRDMAAVEIGIPMPPPDAAGPDASTVPPDERLIIRTLGLRVQVEKIEPAVTTIRDAVDDAGGMVTTVQVATDDTPVYRYEAAGSFADGTPLRGYITARIPPQAVDRFIETVSGLGTVLRQAEDESDVTQEHIDIAARVENLRAQEQRLRELFDRAEEVEDMLAIEREIARVRGDIESYEARLAYLERQAAMATVTIELVSPQPVIAPAGEDWGFVAAVRTGIRGLVYTINGLIIFALSTLPLVVLVLVVWLGVWRIIRVRRARRAPHGDESLETPGVGQDGGDITG